jgi:hypothetical protein
MTDKFWSNLVSPKSDDDDDEIGNHQRNPKADEDLEQV